MSHVCIFVSAICEYLYIPGPCNHCRRSFCGTENKKGGHIECVLVLRLSVFDIWAGVGDWAPTCGPGGGGNTSAQGHGQGD